jgi:hypothetical protein
MRSPAARGLHQENGNRLLPPFDIFCRLFPSFCYLFMSQRKKEKAKGEKKELGFFLFLLMEKRQNKSSKDISPNFFSLL